jgi:hypothetical protein
MAPGADGRTMVRATFKVKTKVSVPLHCRGMRTASGSARLRLRVRRGLGLGLA